jgi:2-C-methyl-D-erythritol 4-phosphate cytidylyltransferase
MQNHVVIVAGGKGLRFGSDLPKQFLLLNAKPVLMHSIECFYNFDNNINIVLVLPVEHFEYWKGLCQEYNFTINHSLVAGGSERFYSVKNGINAINTEGIIGIHDGVRPLAGINTLTRCYEMATSKGNAIPVIDIIDSVRHISDKGNRMVNRNCYKLVQTPQVFESSLLRAAFEQEYDTSFTDDASVVEKMGTPIHLVEGNRENIKITSKFDLQLASFILNANPE